MGPPGSGKGTQARLLCDGLGWYHLATGELFREHLRRDTPLGRLAEQHMSRGEYVPDDVTVGMVRETLAGIAPERRIVFDGFPRTVDQARALDGLLRDRGRRVGHVVLIDVPREELLKRLAARTRTDDTPQVVSRRLEVYETQTRPVIEHYERAASVQKVNGIGAVPEIGQRLREAVGG